MTAQRYTAALALFTIAPAAIGAGPDAAHGRYLIAISGCNDCHTPGYAQQGERIPEAERLTGMSVGFSGPWGVSYPANLRLGASLLGEGDWMAMARRSGLPPMPWTALQAMSDDDLRSIYRYLRGLGTAGQPAPTALAPGQTINTPHFVFVPQMPGAK